MLSRSITMTANQYRAATILHDIAGDVLAQAAPTDDTPLEITVGEVLEVLGKRLASAALGGQ